MVNQTGRLMEIHMSTMVNQLVGSLPSNLLQERPNLPRLEVCDRQGEVSLYVYIIYHI